MRAGAEPPARSRGVALGLDTEAAATLGQRWGNDRRSRWVGAQSRKPWISHPPRCRHDTPLSIAATFRGAMHTFWFFEVFLDSLRVANYYKLDATKLTLMPTYAKLARNRSRSGERLGTIYPSSSSMSSNTNLVLKTASGPAAI